MSVELDWEIFDEEYAASETPPETGPRRSGCRRWGGLALIVGLVLAIGLGVVWQQLRHKQEEVEGAIRDRVTLELDALARGDEELFLSFQEPGGSWRRAQIGRFQDYQTWSQGGGIWLGEPVAYTGEVDQVRVSGKEALVEVGVTCEAGQATCWQRWLYRWRSNIWYHAPLDEDWLGEERQLDTAHFTFVYPQRDEPEVQDLAQEMEAWYEGLAPLYGVEPGAFVTMTLEFAYRPPGSASSEFRWSAHERRSLYAPSLHQVLWGENGEPSDAFYRTLVQFLAEALVADGSGLGLHVPRDFPPEMWALGQELQDWALAPLDIPPDPLAPGTPLVEALVAQHGPEAVASLVAGLDQWETLDQGLEAAGLELADVSRTFAFLLESQHRLSLAGDYSRFSQFLDPQASQDWRFSQRSGFQTSAEDDYWLYNGPAGFRITSVELGGEVAWVEASQSISTSIFVGLPRAGLGEGETPEWPQTVNLYQTFFFRRADGRWLYTSPDPAYFGAERVESSPNLSLRYLERDAVWYEGQVERLQSVLEQMAADLDIDLGDQIFSLNVVIQPGHYGWPSEADISPGGFEPDVDAFFTHHKFTSPRVSGWTDYQIEDPFANLAFSLLRSLAVSKLFPYLGSSAPTSSMLVQAVSVWEYGRLFPNQGSQAWSWWFSLSADPEGIAAQSLADFVPVSATSVQSEAGVNKVWASYQLLIEYLAEAYGPQVIPALLDHFEDVDDVDQWLRLATGDGVEEIEPAWQAWVLETYGQP